MPIYQVGDLVNPNPLMLNEDNPLAVGVIIEMRDMIHRRPEAKILWSDIPGESSWAPITEIIPMKASSV